MAPPHQFGTPLTRFVAPQGAPPKAPVAQAACAAATHLGTPLTRLVAPQGAPPKAPVAQAACVAATGLGTPLTRFAAPQGAPPKAPVAQAACVTATHLGTPLTRFVAPQGVPPKAVLTTAALVAAHGWVLRQANSNGTSIFLPAPVGATCPGPGICGADRARRLVAAETAVCKSPRPPRRVFHSWGSGPSCPLFSGGLLLHLRLPPFLFARPLSPTLF